MSTEREAHQASLFTLKDSAIVFRDEHLVVVDKPPGLTCQSVTDVHADLPLLVSEWIEHSDSAPTASKLFSHQRLDKETSGLIAYGLSEIGNDMLKSGAGQKIYAALCGGNMSAKKRRALERGITAEDLLLYDRGRSEVVTKGELKRRPKRVQDRAKIARSLVQLEASREQLHRFRVELQTGRTHQIRVQLLNLGLCVLGDRIYGETAELHAPRMMLHASELSFSGQHFSSTPDFETPSDLVRALEKFLPIAALRRLDLHRSEATDCYRLFHGAGEGAPGIDIDAYQKHLVLHLRSDEAQDREAEIAEVISELTCRDFDGLYVKRRPKRASTITKSERLERAPAEPLFGKFAPPVFVAKENNLPFSVRLASGMSTGIFLDQRLARLKVRQLLKEAPTSVLNLFSYTSVFGLAAALGAHERTERTEQTEPIDVLNVDASGVAIEQSKENFERLNLSARFFKDDAFVVLSRQLKKGARFGLVICDPPTYATGKKRWKSGAQWRELAQLCAQVTARSGVMLLSSNDERMSKREFRRFVREGAESAGRKVKLRDLRAPRDFPPAIGADPIPHRLWCVLD